MRHVYFIQANSSIFHAELVGEMNTLLAVINVEIAILVVKKAYINLENIIYIV